MARAASGLAELIALLETGGPVPEVDPADLKGAVEFFAELRDRQIAHGLGDPAALGFSFLLEDLAAFCSSDSNLPALVLRAMALGPIIARESPGPILIAPKRVRQLIDAMAGLPLSVEELGDELAIRVKLAQAIDADLPGDGDL